MILEDNSTWCFNRQEYVTPERCHICLRVKSEECPDSFDFNELTVGDYIERV